MHRWDVINHFIKKYDYKSYLEIGYFKGWSFDNVHCNFKIAVDPNPSKIAEHEAAPMNSAILEPPHAIFKMTSDEFFRTIEERPELGLDNMEWDIVFIDGLHEARQVERDIKNSLQYLKENGVIILHDCNPPTYQHVTTGDPGGNWNGDVYKTAIKMRNDPTKEYYTIDTDWGVGVLRPVKGMHTNGSVGIQQYLDNWGAFDTNRQDLLNIISVQEFLKREVINETA